MPEGKIKKEWYCKLSDDGDLALTTAPASILALGWIIGVVGSIIFSPKDLLQWGWVRCLAVIFVYMLIWSAIFMRRREVKE